MIVAKRNILYSLFLLCFYCQNDCMCDEKASVSAERNILAMNAAQANATDLPVDLQKYVTFHLYTRTNPNQSYVLTFNNENLHSSPIDLDRSTKLVIHGWINSYKWDSVQLIKNAYLAKYDVNVILVDYQVIASHRIYFLSQLQTDRLGKYMAAFINTLYENGLRPRDLHIVGHSLGAQISGVIGKNLQRKPARITGLDPALPGYEFVTLQHYLTKTDADFVDVIHTNPGMYGFIEPIGHADFYPNGLSVVQPGCTFANSLLEFCSHRYAFIWFADAIYNPSDFVAHKCKDWSDLMAQKCVASDDDVYMGELCPVTARGIYFLRIQPDVLN